MVAKPKSRTPNWTADCRIAVAVVGPRRWWEAAAEYEALICRLAVLVAAHRGPQREYRNERPGYVHPSRRDY